jgi:hypothetical protein
MACTQTLDELLSIPMAGDTTTEVSIFFNGFNAGIGDDPTVYSSTPSADWEIPYIDTDDPLDGEADDDPNFNVLVPTGNYTFPTLNGTVLDSGVLNQELTSPGDTLNTVASWGFDPEGAQPGFYKFSVQIQIGSCDDTIALIIPVAESIDVGEDCTYSACDNDSAFVIYDIWNDNAECPAGAAPPNASLLDWHDVQLDGNPITSDPGFAPDGTNYGDPWAGVGDITDDLFNPAGASSNDGTYTFILEELATLPSPDPENSDGVSWSFVDPAACPDCTSTSTFTIEMSGAPDPGFSNALVVCNNGEPATP